MGGAEEARGVLHGKAVRYAVVLIVTVSRHKTEKTALAAMKKVKLTGEDIVMVVDMEKK